MGSEKANYRESQLQRKPTTEYRQDLGWLIGLQSKLQALKETTTAMQPLQNLKLQYACCIYAAFSAAHMQVAYVSSM